MNANFISRVITQIQMDNIIYWPDNFISYIRIEQGEQLNMNDKICMIETRKGVRIYFKIVSETPTKVNGIRLLQDEYNNKKFYLTDENYKWPGMVHDGGFMKGRWIHVYN